MEPEYHYGTAQDDKPQRVDKDAGSLEQLDHELDMFEKDIAALEARLGPVLSQYASSKVAVPEEEPASQLRGRVRRIAYLRDSLSDIISRVDL